MVGVSYPPICCMVTRGNEFYITSRGSDVTLWMLRLIPILLM